MYNPYQMHYNQYNKPIYGDDLKIVNGRQSAEQYAMMPNSRTILLDSTCDRFYLKETDASGLSSIKTYDFTEVIDNPQPNYITLDQLKEVLDQYEFAPKKHVEEPKQPGPTKPAPKF